MKTIVESINSSIVNEGKFPKMDIETFIQLVNSELDQDEWSDYGLDKLDDKYFDFIQDHCKIIERGGGYDGNGEDAYSYLEGLGFKKVLKGIDYDDADALTFGDGAELDKDWLQEAGKIAKISAKVGSTYYTAGFETPTFVLFDQNNAIAKDIIKNLEGWY